MSTYYEERRKKYRNINEIWRSLYSIILERLGRIFNLFIFLFAFIVLCSRKFNRVYNLGKEKTKKQRENIKCKFVNAFDEFTGKNGITNQINDKFTLQ